MKLSEFNTRMPQELIASHPAPVRDESRLMVLHNLYYYNHLMEEIRTAIREHRYAAFKAEALAALATGDDDVAHLQSAFELVKTVNLRSRHNEVDSLKWNTFRGSVSSVEDLVLAERLRELAFEGKRWYDLLRYAYRHMEGVDYTTIMADQSAAVTVYAPMLDLMKRKLSCKGNAVAAKLNTEPKLYMPVPLEVLNICPVLKQNPGYSSSENYSKNY